MNILKDSLLPKEVTSGSPSEENLRDSPEDETKFQGKYDNKTIVEKQYFYILMDKPQNMFKKWATGYNKWIFQTLPLMASHRTARAIICRCQSRGFFLN